MRFSDFQWVPEGAGWRWIDLFHVEELHWDDLLDDNGDGVYPEGRARDTLAGLHLSLIGPPAHHAKVQAYVGLV